KTDKAFYIIQMKEKKRPYVPEFNEVKEKVIKAYVKDAAISISKNEAEKILSLIKDEIKNGGSFETAAEKITFTIKSTDFITRNDYIPELGLAAGVADAALPLKDTEISGPVKTLQGWAIVRRDAYQDMDESKFDQEKDEFRERLLSKKKEDVFGAYFLGLKNKAGFISYTNLK
ncbi:MAG: peptidyl-prolyl cis-trans isomerase, partial [Candidatus Omnitrophota bacterium]